MSSSAYPRLYYSGHFYWNPSTYNNDDYQADLAQGGFQNPLKPYNAGEARPTWDTFLHDHGVDRVNFRRWSKELWDLGPDSQGNPQKLPPPEWNFFGGNQCGFLTPQEPRIEPQYGFTRPQEVTRTTGYTGRDGQYHADGDPWLRQSMQFDPGSASAAKLVDVNPTVPWSSQIFADRFVLGTADNGFSAPVEHRMHSRWVGTHNLNQDGGLMIAGPFSAVFQTCFYKQDIEWSGGGGLCEEFKEVLFEAPGHEEVAGLMLRFLTYDTLYFHGLVPPTNQQFPGMVKMRELYVQYFEALDEFEQGKRAERPAPPCNPAYSRVIGWLAPWVRGELASMPGGRILLPIVNANQPTTPTLPEPQTVGARGETITEESPAQNFGPATVERVAEGGKLQRITVDLASTILEFDSKGQFGGFGAVDLGIVLPGQDEPTTLATLVADTASPDYQRAYHRTSGLVDIDASGFPVTLEQFDNNPLVIRAHSYADGKDPPTRVVALTENPLVAQTDQRGVYADEPTAEQAGPTTEFTIQVQHFGRPPSETIGLAVTQYGMAWGPPTPPVSPPSPPEHPAEPQLQLYLLDPQSGSPTAFDNSQLVDASSGEVRVGVRALRPGHSPNQGIPNITFYPVAHAQVEGTDLGPSHPIIPVSSAQDVTIPSYDNSANGQFTWLFYTVARVLPFDNAAALSFAQWLADPTHPPDIEQVNLRIFTEVFANFYLMYPVMDFISSPQKFQEWRGRILQVVDPARFESAAYMPVMRNLSAGHYRMLQAYDEYVSGTGRERLRTRRPPSLAFTR